MTEDENEDEVVHFGFAEQVEAAQSGWLQGRYYSDDGDTVADFLKFENVFEINLFVVGVSHAREKRAFNARKKIVERLLDVRVLADRAFTSLSNGEMRRVLFARALLKGPKKLILDDPMGGLDPARRAKMNDIIAALRTRGMEIVVAQGEKAVRTAAFPVKRSAHRRSSSSPILVDLQHVNIAFGRRVLFRDFSWTIREGERWVLRGANGSGKTTLLSLITGDSPQSYACDVTVFGRKRGAEGVVLADVRAKIGTVSPEQQIYLGESPEELLAEAFRKRPKLLLLDEPCYNQPPAATKRILKTISGWLDKHPRVAAVCVSHRAEHVPAGFTHELAL